MVYGRALRTQPAKKTGVRRTTGRTEDRRASSQSALSSWLHETLTAQLVQATWVFLFANSSVIYSAPFPAFNITWSSGCLCIPCWTPVHPVLPVSLHHLISTPYQSYSALQQQSLWVVMLSHSFLNCSLCSQRELHGAGVGGPSQEIGQL